MTYLGPKVIGNFRQRGPRERKKSTWRDDRPGMSEAHLAMLRQMPCVVCLKAPAGTVHHLKAATGERGMGVKSTDKWALPMCFGDHEAVERIGTKNETNHFRALGIDAFVLAIALWGARGDEALIRKLIVEHKQGRPSPDCSRSSAVERPPDTRDVAGSIPADCTSSARGPGTR